MFKCRDTILRPTGCSKHKATSMKPYHDRQSCIPALSFSDWDADIQIGTLELVLLEVFMRKTFG